MTIAYETFAPAKGCRMKDEIHDPHPLGEWDGNWCLGTEDPDVPRPVLEIGSWSSHCSVCRRDADISPTHHVLLGYGKDNGKPGCGAKYAYAVSYYDYGTDRTRKDFWYANSIPNLPIFLGDRVIPPATLEEQEEHIVRGEG